MSRRFPRVALALGFLSLSATAGAAGVSGLPFDPSQLGGNLVNQDVANAIVKTVGLALDHRPYEAATPLGTSVGFDLSLEATIVKIPGDLFPTLEANGLPAGGSSIPFLPAAKLHMSKGLSNWVDIGGSGFFIPNFKIFGTDLKFVLEQGEEGPTWAFRVGYNYTDLNMQGIDVSTKTLTPALLVSRKLDFADPYVGIGLQYAIGDIDGTISQPLPAPLTGSVSSDIHAHGVGYGGLGFVGLVIKPPNAALRLGIEMSYSTAGATYLGTKVGFAF